METAWGPSARGRRSGGRGRLDHRCRCRRPRRRRGLGPRAGQPATAGKHHPLERWWQFRAGERVRNRDRRDAWSGGGATWTATARLTSSRRTSASRTRVYFGDGVGRVRTPQPARSGGTTTRATRSTSRTWILTGIGTFVVANVGARNAVYFNRGGEPAAFDEFRFGLRGLRDLRAGGRGSERRRVPGHRDREFRGTERPLRECGGRTRLEDVVSGQLRRLPDPAHQELLVGRIVLVDVEVAHVFMP